MLHTFMKHGLFICLKLNKTVTLFIVVVVDFVTFHADTRASNLGLSNRLNVVSCILIKLESTSEPHEERLFSHQAICMFFDYKTDVF